MPATATRPKRVTRTDVERIRAAEAKVAKAKRALERATEEREQVRARYRGRFPANRPIEAGGCLIKRIVSSTGQRFRLSAYLEHHKLSAAMRPFVTEPGSRERWDIKELEARR